MTINPFILHGEEITPVRKLLYLKALAGGAPLSDYTVTGNPVSFNTNVSKPLSVLAAFSPVQAGSGDPSPENIRPITGFTGANVYLSATGADDPDKQTFAVTFPALGKNLFDKNAVDDGKIWWKGKKTASASYSASALIPVVPGEKYTINRNSAGQSTICYFDESGTYIDQTTSNPTTFTIPSGIYFVAFNVTTAYLDTAMFEKGSTASPYEPYNATAYGGTLDLSTGVLTVDKKCVSLNDPDKWTQPSTNFIYDVYYNDRKQGYREGDMCSCFKTSSRSYPYLIWAGNALNRYALYPGSTGITIDDLKALSEAGSIQCCYDLETPLVYQLSPVEILSLVGDNVIWSDLNGDLSVTYKKKGS